MANQYFLTLNSSGITATDLNPYVRNADLLTSGYIRSLNGLKNTITLVGSGGTTIWVDGQTIQVSASGGGGGITSVNGATGPAILIREQLGSGIEILTSGSSIFVGLKPIDLTSSGFATYASLHTSGYVRNTNFVSSGFITKAEVASSGFLIAPIQETSLAYKSGLYNLEIGKFYTEAIGGTFSSYGLNAISSEKVQPFIVATGSTDSAGSGACLLLFNVPNNVLPSSTFNINVWTRMNAFKSQVSDNVWFEIFRGDNKRTVDTENMIITAPQPLTDLVAHYFTYNATGNFKGGDMLLISPIWLYDNTGGITAPRNEVDMIQLEFQVRI